MLINYGCEITVSVANLTPMICLLDIHPERRAEIRAETPFLTQPLVPTSSYIDMFGNQCRRFVAPAGDLTLRLDGTITDRGLQDPVVAQADEIPVQNLPSDVLGF